jgi:putative PIN family toxin of toxin-antitoxin system
VYIVLDTNVLVSSLLNPDGSPALVLNLLLNGRITILYDNRILGEYLEVLTWEKFGFRREWIDPLIDFIRQDGEFVTADPTSVPFNDPGDRKFLEVHISGNGDVLVSGNLKHYPVDKRIVSPGVFLSNWMKSTET